MLVPADTPLTMPVLPTVAYEVANDVHEPPVAASVSVIAADSQTEVRPLIIPASGSGSTVTVYVAVTLPQPLVTV